VQIAALPITRHHFRGDWNHTPHPAAAHDLDDGQPRDRAAHKKPGCVSHGAAAESFFAAIMAIQMQSALTTVRTPLARSALRSYRESHGPHRHETGTRTSPSSEPTSTSTLLSSPCSNIPIAVWPDMRAALIGHHRAPGCPERISPHYSHIVTSVLAVPTEVSPRSVTSSRTRCTTAGLLQRRPCEPPRSDTYVGTAAPQHHARDRLLRVLTAASETENYSHLQSNIYVIQQRIHVARERRNSNDRPSS
jgi:hypothetical protein